MFSTTTLPFFAQLIRFRLSHIVAAMLMLPALLLSSTTVWADNSAIPTDRATKHLLLDIQKAGKRLVAVGERGHIIYSDDSGHTWTQAKVPTRVTLTTLFFIDARNGWAAGHEGVILKSTDGGKVWRQVLDGHSANQLIISALKHAQASGTHSDPEALAWLLGDAMSFADEGASRPFLDLWFRDPLHGFAVGAYGLFFTTHDGGDTWQPAPLALDNPDLFHLNQLTQVGRRLYIAGEAGSIFMSEDNGVTWAPLDSPYEGTFFGIAPLGQDQVVAFGLRGNAFRLNPAEEVWHKVSTHTDISLFGSQRSSDGTLLLVGNNGLVLTLDTSGNLASSQFIPSKSSLLAAIELDNGQRVLVGSRGIESMEHH